MNTTLVTTGANLRKSHSEVLAIATLEQVAHLIMKPSAALVHQVSLVKKVSRLDKKAAADLKQQLPFFCCGHFTGGLRKLENFTQAQAFVFDIDNLHKHHQTPQELKEALQQNQEVALLYTSPSGNGIKVVVVLSEPITQTHLFTIAYKVYLTKLVQTYQLHNCVDTCTADATRVSFLSADEQAWFNPLAFEVSPAALVPQASVALVNNSPKAVIVRSEEAEKGVAEPTPPPYKQILATLQPGGQAKPPRQVFVPSILHEVTTQVQAQAAAVGIAVPEITDINYGKKIRFAHGMQWAELNLFYGKAGFSVVKTPKKGSLPELADVGERIILTALYGNNAEVHNTAGA